MSDPFVKVSDGGPSRRFVGIGDGEKQVQSVEGILLDIEESSKYPGTIVYIMGTKDEVLAVGGNKFLSDKVTEIGALYRIIYVGKSRGKSGRSYKTFDVFTVDAETAKREGLDKNYKSADDVDGDAREDA